MDSLELILVAAFACLAAIAAIGFVAFRQPVHAALSFAVTVLSGAGLYLLLDAPYVAISTVIVYAGATIIIFLFALMFAQRSNLQSYDRAMANPLMSSFAAISLCGIIVYVVSTASFDTGSYVDGKAQAQATVAGSAVPPSAPRVADLGRVMYTRYLWAIELAGAVLLIATVGAILIAKDDSSPDTGAESGLS